MGQVFVSYSRQNKDIADALVDKLSAAGLDVWIDREDIRAGRHWRTEIVTAIDTCDSFVLLLSPHSASSDNVLKEITLAEGAKRRIFPVMIQETELLPDMRYLLAGVQIVNMVTGDLDIVYQQLEAGLLENQRIVAEAAAKASPAQETKEAEIVIKGVNIEDFDASQQEKLLFFLSEMTQTDAAQMSVSTVTAGSVHVFITMPAQSAYSLKALALNDDPRLRKYGIVAVAISGSTFVVALSIPFWAALLASFTGSTVAIVGTVATVATVTTLAVVAINRQSPDSGQKVADTVTEAVASATYTQSPPIVDTPTDTPVDSDTPVFTETTAPTTAVTETATPPPPFITVDADSICRSTFSRLGDTVVFLSAGETSDVLAISADGHWFYISPAGTGNRCWVSDATVTFSGIRDGLEIWYPSPTPLPTATSVFTATPVPTTMSAPAMSVGISGLLWYDVNKDDKQDTGIDQVLPGVTVYLKDKTCLTLIATTLSNTAGEYDFLSLPPDDYCIEVDIATLPPLVYYFIWDPAVPDFPPGHSPYSIVTAPAGTHGVQDFIFVDY